jgi:hypothetical protein
MPSNYLDEYYLKREYICRAEVTTSTVNFVEVIISTNILGEVATSIREFAEVTTSISNFVEVILDKLNIK